MTALGLIRKLEKVVKKNGPRTRVCIDLKAMRAMHSTHEDYSTWELTHLEVDTMRWEKEDSYYLANGQERMTTVVVLS